jgi:hypothetical protein
MDALHESHGDSFMNPIMLQWDRDATMDAM